MGRTSNFQRSTSNVQFQNAVAVGKLNELARFRVARSLVETLDDERWPLDVSPRMPPPVLEPTPPSLARQFYRRRARVHHWVSRRVIRPTVVALLLIFG